MVIQVFKAPKKLRRSGIFSKEGQQRRWVRSGATGELPTLRVVVSPPDAMLGKGFCLAVARRPVEKPLLVGQELPCEYNLKGGMKLMKERFVHCLYYVISFTDMSRISCLSHKCFQVTYFFLLIRPTPEVVFPVR